MSATASPTQATAAQEWRLHWLLVLSAMIGLSLGTIPSATLGLFMEPLENEFGWSRTAISAGLTIFALVSTPLTPFAGVLVDKFGPRRVAVPGLALSGLSFAAFSLMGSSIAFWFLIWVAYTLASLLIRTLVWNTAVARAFSKSRGLAIAILLCGTALAQAFSPIIARWLVDDYGWRFAYVGLGLGWGGFALILNLLFFRERRAEAAPLADGGTPATALVHGGLTVREAVRSLTMNRIALAIFLQSAMGVAIVVHIVPMLTQSGLSRAEAAGIASLLGIASVVGKLVTGWLVDRITTSLLPLLCFSGPAIGYFVLLQGYSSAWVTAAAVFVLGYCSGAALQLATYLSSRYAGLRSFGTIFGMISALMGLATGIGSAVAGVIYDVTGSYALLLTAGIPIAVIAGLSVFRLGPYPEFKTATD